jgi:hypothetical protein
MMEIDDDNGELGWDFFQAASRIFVFFIFFWQIYLLTGSCVLSYKYFRSFIYFYYFVFEHSSFGSPKPRRAQ